MTRKRGSISIGPLSPNGPGAHYVLEAMGFAPSTLICNATIPSSRPLELSKLWARSASRPGADDHQQFRSRGTRC